ncbi:hypothetical protein M9H77_34694 [Catharanthus roseus]|uniref:Uncharacterized protein n=1 Tax=Catharanthus roseus TaxID=4058 RepID=A0ACB9ZNM1_CATRO|nr:hypothetical protein M9H77_34694 [Catharanthus roseus]
MTYFLGLQIKQTKERIFINQEKYIKQLLKRFEMSNAKGIGTSMSSSLKLDKDERGKKVNKKWYRGMIGNLLYLMVSKPDITFAVCLCYRFQACPKESHLIAVKRILRYLISSYDYGLWYSKQSCFDLIAYIDADYAGCKVEKKSTSGNCQFLGDA